MSLNSNKPQEGFKNLCLENGNRYTSNLSAFSIHKDLSALLSSSQSLEENSFEFKEPKKRYTKEMLFKIRNERTKQIDMAIPSFFKDQIAKKEVWDPEQHFFGPKTVSFSTNNQEETKNCSKSSNADQELLSLIKGSSKKESLIDIPNKKKPNAFDRFLYDHPDLVNESVMKHKIPKAPTVQEIESKLIPHSAIHVEELESMQLKQSKIGQNQMDVDDDYDSGLMDEKNVNISEILNQDKIHFNQLIHKLYSSSNRK